MGQLLCKRQSSLGDHKTGRSEQHCKMNELTVMGNLPVTVGPVLCMCILAHRSLNLLLLWRPKSMTCLTQVPFPCKHGAGLAGACIHNGSGRAHSVPFRAGHRTHRHSGRRSRALAPRPCRTLQGAPLPHHRWPCLFRCTFCSSGLVLVTLPSQPACSKPITFHLQCNSSSSLCHVSSTPVPSSPQLIGLLSLAVDRKHTLCPPDTACHVTAVADVVSHALPDRWRRDH